MFIGVIKMFSVQVIKKCVVKKPRRHPQISSARLCSGTLWLTQTPCTQLLPLLKLLTRSLAWLPLTDLCSWRQGVARTSQVISDFLRAVDSTSSISYRPPACQKTVDWYIIYHCSCVWYNSIWIALRASATYCALLLNLCMSLFI